MAKVLALLIAASLLLACEKEIKTPSEDVLSAREGFAMAEGMRDAYTRKAFDEMARFCTVGGFKAVSRSIRKFDDVKLEFSPRWVELEEDGTALLYVSWKGTWSYEGRSEDLAALAVFKLTGRPLRVDEIVRGNPFENPLAAPRASKSEQ